MPDYDPTPDELDERCQEVQDMWDEDTRESRKRTVAKRFRAKGWTPPVISISDIHGAITDTFNTGGDE